MSALLYLPGILLVLFRRFNLRGVAGHLIILLTAQVAIGLSFLREDEIQYMKGAFNFGRAFLYKWTVNWRFVDEDTFLSAPFARLLLAGHLMTLFAFGLFKWCRSDGGAFPLLIRGLKERRSRTFSPALVPVTADCECTSCAFRDACNSPYTTDVTTVLMTSNLIGILFARSLHYQFYSWYAQQLPFLAWRTRYPVVAK